MVFKQLQFGAAHYYKSGQRSLLQIGAAIINRGRFVTNWGSYYKSRQICYKLGQLLQIDAEQDGTKIIIPDINPFSLHKKLYH